MTKPSLVIIALGSPPGAFDLATPRAPIFFCLVSRHENLAYVHVHVPGAYKKWDLCRLSLHLRRCSFPLIVARCRTPGAAISKLEMHKWKIQPPNGRSSGTYFINYHPHPSTEKNKTGRCPATGHWQSEMITRAGKFPLCSPFQNSPLFVRLLLRSLIHLFFHSLILLLTYCFIHLAHPLVCPCPCPFSQPAAQ